MSYLHHAEFLVKTIREVLRVSLIRDCKHLGNLKLTLNSFQTPYCFSSANSRLFILLLNLYGSNSWCIYISNNFFQKKKNISATHSYNQTILFFSYVQPSGSLHSSHCNKVDGSKQRLLLLQAHPPDVNNAQSKIYIYMESQQQKIGI